MIKLIGILLLTSIPTADDENFSIFNGDAAKVAEDTEVEATPASKIIEYGPDDYVMDKGAAIVEFYDGAKGAAKETTPILQKLANDGFSINRVETKSGKSKLGTYFKVTKVPTFIVLYKQKEIARIDGIPTDNQVLKLRDLANEKKKFIETVVGGQVILFTDNGLYVSEEDRSLVNNLIKSGFDVRQAVYSKEEHKKWFSHFKVEKYPAFILIDDKQEEVMRKPGDDSTKMLKDVKGAWYAYKGVTVKAAESAVVNGGARMLYFTADWCGPCRSMKPIINSLIGEGYNVEKVDVDREPQKATHYRISAIPAYVFVDSSGKEYSRAKGSVSKNALVSQMQKGQ